MLNDYKLYPNATADRLLDCVTDEAFMVDFFDCLSANKDFRKAISSVVALTMEKASTYSGIKCDTDMILKTSLDDYSDDNAETEAKILSAFYSALMDIKGDSKFAYVKNMTVNDLTNLCKKIGDFKNSYFLKQVERTMIEDIMDSLDSGSGVGSVINTLGESILAELNKK